MRDPSGWVYSSSGLTRGHSRSAHLGGRALTARAAAQAAHMPRKPRRKLCGIWQKNCGSRPYKLRHTSAAHFSDSPGTPLMILLGTHPSDLKKYRRGLVSSELLSETEIIFLLETKGQQPARTKKYRRGLVSSELLTETEIIFLLETKGQQPATSFRAACGQGGRAARGARAAGSKGRRRRLSHLEQLADQRPAQLQQRVADLVVHLAQRQLKNLR